MGNAETTEEPTTAPAGGADEGADASGSRAQGTDATESDSTGSPGSPRSIEAVTAERDKLYEQLLRTAADFDNFRKRHRRDVDEAERRGAERMLLELLPVFDNLERAVSAAVSAEDAKSVAEGVSMVLKLFEDCVGKFGVSRLNVLGERFDPALHDAVHQIETDAHPTGTIVAEVTAGYRRNDRVIRPAMVVVAKSAAATIRPPETPGNCPTPATDAAESGDSDGGRE